MKKVIFIEIVFINQIYKIHKFLGIAGPHGIPGQPGNFAGSSAPEETEVIQGPSGYMGINFIFMEFKKV